MEALLISACLLGENCKYSGGNNALPKETLTALERRFRLVPVCPERDGGLPTPRIPSERRGERVLNREGEDVTEPFRRGAESALETARREGTRKWWHRPSGRVTVAAVSSVVTMVALFQLPPSGI